MFKLSIETENDAFAEDLPGEVARILRVAADNLERGRFDGSAFRLQDVNGNTVGKMWTKEYDGQIHYGTHGKDDAI